MDSNLINNVHVDAQDLTESAMKFASCKSCLKSILTEDKDNKVMSMIVDRVQINIVNYNRQYISDYA